MIVAGPPSSDHCGGDAASSATGSPLRLAFVGSLWPGSTALQRCQAAQSLGHVVHPLSYHDPAGNMAPFTRLRRLAFKARIPFVDHADTTGINAALRDLAEREILDVLWLEKALVVRRSTLLAVKRAHPHCLIVGFSNDDMMNRANQSRQLFAQLPLTDIFFTTKSFNVAELGRLGCRDVRFVCNSYDPDLHRPLAVEPAMRQALGGPVGFIGFFEHERARSMLALAKDGIPVRVWGPGWERCRLRHPLLRIERQSLYGEDYARAINAFDINLCFLRKVNRDLQTSRSVEIPACEAFMMAERTREHESLFVDGEEAVFFSDDGELVERTRRYLAEPEARRAIARRGLERCRRDRYDNRSRMAQMLQQCASLWRKA